MADTSTCNGYGTVEPLKQPDEDAAEYDRGRWHSVLFTCFICLLSIGEGYDIGVLNGAIVRVQDEFDASAMALSAIVAITPAAVIPGALLGSAYADLLGRKLALFGACLVLTVGPISMALAPDITLLLVTRGVVGMGIGAGIVVTSMYISEVAPADIRGGLSAFMAVFINIGILLGYMMNMALLGIKDDWRWMLALGAVLPFVMMLFVLSPKIDESPRWLFVHGRVEEAEQVLARFSGRLQAQKDIAAMQQDARRATSDASDALISWAQVMQAYGETGPVQRMLLAGMCVPIVAMLCGYLAMAYYSSTLMKGVAGERNAFAATIVMGIVKVLFVLIAVSVLDRAGRRPLLLASCAITGAACAWIALAFSMSAHWKSHAFGFSLFMAGFEIGLGPLMFVYPAEVLVTAWRAKGLGVGVFLSRVFGASSLFLFPLVVKAIGPSSTFLVQTLINLSSGCIIWKFVYETKGVSLEGVSKLFNDEA